MKGDSTSKRPRVGLVLSAGGARGAYEVGVLRYIRERLRVDTQFDVITGSSIGALNGSYIAATCDRPRAQGRALTRVWNELELEDILKFGWSQLRNLPQLLVGRKSDERPTHGAVIGGLIEPAALHRLVQQLPWRGVTQNIHAGHLRALSVTATEVATGIVTVFIQTREGKVPVSWPKITHHAVVHTQITASHALASGAIPVLLPAVRVGDRLYADGGLRQNTPLRPALNLGADRLLVIGLRHKPDEPEYDRLRVEARDLFPSALFMLGKVLNVLLLEQVEHDLDRIHRVNQFISAGEAEYGPEFPLRIAKRMNPETQRPYRQIHTLLIRPSVDLGEIAWSVVRGGGLSKRPGIAARWIRRAVTAGDARQESDLASYLLFTAAYTRRLMELG
ncbi:MAG: patatin-like phospholipase family protein, partial [Myxococcales bacterium]|nr:patatin-like phospholipase family protein [Myxococcales bacterium]